MTLFLVSKVFHHESISLEYLSNRKDIQSSQIPASAGGPRLPNSSDAGLLYK